MTFQDYFDSYHDIAHSEKRYVVTCVKTYDNTGTYVSLNIFKKENGDNEFRFNQKLSLCRSCSKWEKILMLSEE